MVWFQCEDCGENLKKPKLPNHFRCCSAYHLSCIDCGETFTRQTVQSHTQCISEAEKYGPKNGHHSKPANAAPPPNPQAASKPAPDFDIHAGLSTRPPWNCSLCNTSTTSRQTLLSHAQGKKHRAKARAFHASQNPPSDKPADLTAHHGGTAKGSVSGNTLTSENCKMDAEANDQTISLDKDLKATEKSKEEEPPFQNVGLSMNADSLSKKKRKLNDSGPELTNGEVIQAETTESVPFRKKKKGCNSTEDKTKTEETIKWKKLITSSLKLAPDGVLKLKKLEKLVLKSLKEAGVVLDGTSIRDILVEKIHSSSKVELEKKNVRLLSKCAV